MSLLAALLNAPALDDDAFLAQLRAKLAATETPATETPASETPVVPAQVPTGAPPSFAPGASPAQSSATTAQSSSAPALAVIALTLPPRLPIAGEPTSETLAADLDRSAYASTADYELALDDASDREFSVHARVRDALDLREVSGTARSVATCPACGEAELVVERPTRYRTETYQCVTGACSGGCDVETLARAIAERVTESETEAARAVLDFRGVEMASNVSFARFLTEENARPQGWVCDELIVDDALTLLVGAYSSGKSNFAFGLAAHVVLGKRFLNRAVKQCRALVVSLEGTSRDFRRRFDQITRGIGHEAADLIGRMDVYDAPVSVEDEASLARLNDYVSQRDYGLVILDHLTELRAGAGAGSENDNTLMASAVRPLAALARDHHIAVVVLHHAGANGEARGATSVLGAVDETFYITKSSDGKDSPITLRRGRKTKCGADALSLRYRIVGGGTDGSPMVFDLLASDRESAAPSDRGPRERGDERVAIPRGVAPNGEDRRARLLALMREMGPTKWTPLRNALGGDPKTAADIRDALKTEGVVMCRDYLWQHVDGGAQ